jgi:hypothetical protein
MTRSDNPAAPFIALYGLDDAPSGQEEGVLAAQLARLAASLRTRLAPSETLFALEPAAHAAALERLADEQAR